MYESIIIAFLMGAATTLLAVAAAVIVLMPVNRAHPKLRKAPLALYSNPNLNTSGFLQISLEILNYDEMLLSDEQLLINNPTRIRSWINSSTSAASFLLSRFMGSQNSNISHHCSKLPLRKWKTVYAVLRVKLVK